MTVMAVECGTARKSGMIPFLAITAFLLLLPCLAQEPGAEGGKAPAPPPRDEKAIKAILDRLNEIRKGAGLKPVVEDPKLSVGCALHANYLALNEGNEKARNAGAHREERDLPGYSEVGDKSAARSVVQRLYKYKDPGGLVDALVATLYHRLPLLDSGLRSLGIGCSSIRENGLVIVIDTCDVDYSTKAEVYPVLCPNPEQQDVPLEYALGGTEWPDPRPNKQENVGYPITVICNYQGWRPGEAMASLTAGGEVVDCWVFTPENPALKEQPLLDVVCLLPKEKLKPETRYTVSVRCKQYGVEKTPEWSKTWSFTTGREDDKK